MALNYRIEEKEGYGKIMVSNVDMLPGAIVVVESPLMYFANEFKNSCGYDKEYLNADVACYRTFLQLNS